MSIFLKDQRLTSCHWVHILISYWKPNDICAFFLALLITSDLVMDFFVLLVNFSWFYFRCFCSNQMFDFAQRRDDDDGLDTHEWILAPPTMKQNTELKWTDRRFELSKVVKLKAIQIHGYKMNSIVAFKVLSRKPVQNHHETQIRKSCFEMIQNIKIHMMSFFLCCKKSICTPSNSAKNM